MGALIKNEEARSAMPDAMRLAGRALRRSSREVPVRLGVSRNALMILLGSMIAASVVVFGIWAFINSPPDRTQQLDIAIRLMKKGEVGPSARIAESIDPKTLRRRSDISKREFIVGVFARTQAEGIQQRRIAITENERAVKHLEKSREIGFPQGYEGLGNFHLGMALYDLFRWDDALDPLEIAADRWPQGRNDAIERLIDIDLSFEDPNPEGAMERITFWRSLPTTAADDSDRMIVKEMETLHVQGEFEKALSLRSSVPQDSRFRPTSELVCGRSLYKLAIDANPAKRDSLLRETKTVLEQLIESPSTKAGIRRMGILELGRTLRALGRTTQAISTLSALRLSSPFESESLAGAVEEIDGLIDLNRITDAIVTLEHVTSNFGDIRWYQNNWNPLPKIRDRFVDAGHRILNKNDFANAAQFSQYLPPVCQPLDSVELRAKTYERWAEALRQVKRDQIPGKKKGNRDATEDGQIERFNKIAGAAYETLAMRQLRSPEFSDLLWRSIENYRLAGAFQESNRMLKTYLQLESRENQARGLLVQARNFSGLNELNTAKKSLDSLMLSHGSSPLIYEARLESARIHRSQEEYDVAEELLIQNLYFGDLKPESPIWRESLLELGELLFQRGELLFRQGKIKQAKSTSETSTNGLSQEVLATYEKSYEELLKSVVRIEEGLRRFPDEPRRFQMLYDTARAYRMASSWPELLLREDRILNEESISGWTAKKRDLLNQARNAYSTLRREIVATPDALKLDPNAESHLRNSFFGEADLLYDAELFEDAMTSYRDAANRFNNEPESLEALVRIASCQKQLGRLNESRRTLELAKDVLDRIPADKDKRFVAVTRHSRTGWNDELNWLLSGAQKPAVANP